jgi:hypothetical protein
MFQNLVVRTTPCQRAERLELRSILRRNSTIREAICGEILGYPPSGTCGSEDGLFQDLHFENFEVISSPKPGSAHLPIGRSFPDFLT